MEPCGVMLPLRRPCHHRSERGRDLYFVEFVLHPHNILNSLLVGANKQLCSGFMHFHNLDTRVTKPFIPENVMNTLKAGET